MEIGIAYSAYAHQLTLPLNSNPGLKYRLLFDVNCQTSITFDKNNFHVPFVCCLCFFVDYTSLSRKSRASPERGSRFRR